MFDNNGLRLAIGIDVNSEGDVVISWIHLSGPLKRVRKFLDRQVYSDFNADVKHYNLIDRASEAASPLGIADDVDLS